MSIYYYGTLVGTYDLQTIPTKTKLQKPAEEQPEQAQKPQPVLVGDIIKARDYTKHIKAADARRPKFIVRHFQDA